MSMLQHDLSTDQEFNLVVFGVFGRLNNESPGELKIVALLFSFMSHTFTPQLV